MVRFRILYGKLSKKQVLRNLALSVCIAFLCAPALAQETYTPPPMFGAPAPLPPVTPEAAEPRKPSYVPPAEEKPRYIEPKRSKAVPVEVQEKSPDIETSAPEHKTSQALPPLPAKKPAVPKYISKKVKREGVVRGPKTMPAVPAKDYHSETLFENEDGQIEGAILKRHTDIQEKQEAPPKQEKAIVTPSSMDIFALADGKAKRATLLYPKGSADTVDGQSWNAVGPKSVQILKENPNWRIQIMSYATPYDDGQSSDRRMALNRALNIREHLLASGVEPQVIDIRALGNQAPDGEKDRVDVIYYAPDAAL